MINRHWSQVSRGVDSLFASLLSFVVVGGVLLSRVSADDLSLSTFEVTQLTGEYFSEGIAVGDLNQDGHRDIVHGPFWFEGPNFQKRHEIRAAKVQNVNGYADSFFSWVEDINGDQFPDLLTCALPGTPAVLYLNPGRDQGETALRKGNWDSVVVFDHVGNESPQFLQLVGDLRRELICVRGQRLGYASIGDDPLKPWSWHVVSDRPIGDPFSHGLGVGDVNSDGRLDLLVKEGWFEQPEKLDDDPEWAFHPAAFAGPGGADMFVDDVDGDGDADVITSLSAHAFGLAWYEQIGAGDSVKEIPANELVGESPRFRRHIIMGDKPEQNEFGLLFSELHAVALADMDGDGLKDIVTGKTYWSHHRQSPMWDAGAVVYWFKLQREESHVHWLPFQAAAETGIGRQLVIDDINQDGLPDIAVGGMKGAHVLTQARVAVSPKEYQAALPQRPKTQAAGLTPPEAAAQMTVPPGFHVQLAAGEPVVHQPIAMCYDYRGRLWIAEAYTYPQRAPEGSGKDRIVILEDTNQDGTLDSRKVFIEGLNLVSGLEVGFGGVYVGAAPYLMWIPDTNGDDLPDGIGSPESQGNGAQEIPQNVLFPKDVPAGAVVLLDGFGWQDTHETLNGFNWGPDGWLYGCHGVFTHSKVGKPGTPDEQREGLNAGVWRYHPVHHRFEVFAHGTSNPWGVDFNDHGQAFLSACVIPHLWHMVQGGRYHRQGGQHFNAHTYADIKTIADHAHYVGNIRDHAWWGHEPIVAGDTSKAGGGHAHCGGMVYLGDNWPKEYRNQFYFNNIHGNRINCDVLEQHGSGFVGHHGQDLLLANDLWYRGINLRCGPDGTVHLIDWYDKNACHRTTPEIWDRTNGRVYRIAYGDRKPVAVDLEKLTPLELAELHLHPNDWYVRMARKRLMELSQGREFLEPRADGSSPMQEAISRLVEISKGDVSVPQRLRAGWTLSAIGREQSWQWLDETGPESEYLRAWAIQVELENWHIAGSHFRKLVEVARKEPSPVVRMYMASALQRMHDTESWELTETLVHHAEDAEDHNIPLLLWYGIEPHLLADPARAMKLANSSKIPLVTRFIIRRLAADNSSLPVVMTALGESSDIERQSLVLNELLSAFEGRVKIPMPDSWEETYEKLLKSERADIRDRADQVAVILGDKRIFPRMRSQLADPQANVASRQQALDILLQGKDPDAAKAMVQALAEPKLRGSILRGLVAYDSVETTAAILKQYGSFSEADKRDAINTLCARPTSALALLDLIERESIPRTDLHAYNVRQLVGFENDQLTARIGAVWGEVRESSEDKKAQIAALKQVLTPKSLAGSDISNGRRLFAKTCASCHTLFGEGGKIGPDITGSNRGNLDYILDNIIDPSAVMPRDYRMTVLVLSDGRQVQGLVQKETDSALTIRTINDTIVVPLEEVEVRKLSELSMMPEKLLDQLQPGEIRDLVAYLGSPNQVALRGPRSPIDPQTGTVPNALEGEALKIVGKTGGSARSQPMGGFKDDKWSGNDHLWWTGAKPGDKLSLEINVPAEGNYSVEFTLTKARDYGIVQLSIDNTPLGPAVDCFNTPTVITTGQLSHSPLPLKPGPHTLTLQITGSHPDAVKGYMVGLDYLRLVPVE